MAASSSADAPLTLLPLDVPVDVDMDYAEVQGLKGKRMSRVVFGTLFLSKADDPCALLDAVRQTGCNAFDCAAVYGGGECERLMGVWLKERKIPRDDIVLITKGGCHGQEKLWAADLRPATVERDLAKSLSAMGVSHIDIYILHRDDPNVPVSDVVDMMDSQQHQGRFTAWGVSNWDVSRLREAIAYAEANGKCAPICDSPQVSLARPSRAVWPDTKFFSPSSSDFYVSSGVAVLGWECLAKGFMTGKWSREDGEAARGLTAEQRSRLSPVGETAAEWRELQLTTAYCYEDNFARRERAEALAKKKGLSLAQVALKYVASQPFNAFVLVGTTSAKHFGENSVGGSKARLTAAEVRYLEFGDGSLSPAASEADLGRPAKQARLKEQSPEELVPLF